MWLVFIKKYMQNWLLNNKILYNLLGGRKNNGYNYKRSF